jgi:hypothetical protein
MVLAGVCATHSGSDRGENGRCEGRQVQFAERGAAACVPVVVLGTGDAPGSHVPLLRRHHFADRGVWVYASGLRAAHALLPDGVPAIQANYALLVELVHHRGVLNRGSRRLRGILPQHRHECKNLSSLCKCLRGG